MPAIPRQQVLYSKISNRGDMQSIGTGLLGKNSARHDFIRDVGNYRFKLQKWESSQQLQTLCCKRRVAVRTVSMRRLRPGCRSKAIFVAGSATIQDLLATPKNFLFPAAAAGKIYRQKFREAIRTAGFEENIDPSVWCMEWIVDVEPVQDGRAVLKYLAPYVFRVAISDIRILECTDSTVTYRHTPSGSKSALTKTEDGWKFARGFLQHTLPKGFRKVRSYGWMASNSRTTLDLRFCENRKPKIGNREAVSKSFSQGCQRPSAPTGLLEKRP